MWSSRILKHSWLEQVSFRGASFLQVCWMLGQGKSQRAATRVFLGKKRGWRVESKSKKRRAKSKDSRLCTSSCFCRLKGLDVNRAKLIFYRIKKVNHISNASVFKSLASSVAERYQTPFMCRVIDNINPGLNVINDNHVKPLMSDTKNYPMHIVYLYIQYTVFTVHLNSAMQTLW